jgi:hypothetical protein
MNYNTNYINYNNNYVSNDEGLSKGQKIIIISLMLVFLILLLIAVYLRKGSIFWGKGSLNTRTVMIFLDGNDLESAGAIATSELESLDPKKIDLTKTNILVYTGGTKEWHNFVKNDENAIYKLTDDGFEKVETYPKKNMGNPDTLTEFLNYGYNNYKADSYNLLFFDHGGAVDGAIYDDFTNDNLSLVDIVTALSNSPFNENNKLQTIVFRTCLNGTVEVATALSKFANYMVASEEVTYGSPLSSVLNFLNEVKANDSGIEYGKKFINSYQNQIDEITFSNTATVTYAITDLSKIDSLNEKINDYFSKINVDTNYATLARTRSNLFQYGDSVKSYDMVDLYDLVNNTKHLDPSSADALLKAIEDTVIFNHTNNSTSHGLSIYFPYNGEEVAKKRFLNVYNGINSLSGYRTFINTFNEIKSKQKSQAFSLMKNDSNVSEDGEITFKLTDEQAASYSHAVIMLFKKDDSHAGYYAPLYSSDEVTMKDGVLSSNINNKLIKIVDGDDSGYILTISRDKSGTREITTAALVYDDDEKVTDGLDSWIKRVTLYLYDEAGKPKISFAKLDSRNELADGTLINLKDMERMQLFLYEYKMVDSKGNYTSDWESAPVTYGYEKKPNEIEFKWSSLDDEGNYYCVFTIYDINGYKYSSNFIKVGD